MSHSYVGSEHLLLGIIKDNRIRVFCIKNGIKLAVKRYRNKVFSF